MIILQKKCYTYIPDTGGIFQYVTVKYCNAKLFVVYPV